MEKDCGEDQRELLGNCKEGAKTSPFCQDNRGEKGNQSRPSKVGQKSFGASGRAALQSRCEKESGARHGSPSFEQSRRELPQYGANDAADFTLDSNRQSGQRENYFFIQSRFSGNQSREIRKANRVWSQVGNQPDQRRICVGFHAPENDVSRCELCGAWGSRTYPNFRGTSKGFWFRPGRVECRAYERDKKSWSKEFSNCPEGPGRMESQPESEKQNDCRAGPDRRENWNDETTRSQQIGSKAKFQSAVVGTEAGLSLNLRRFAKDLAMAGMMQNVNAGM